MAACARRVFARRPSIDASPRRRYYRTPPCCRRTVFLHQGAQSHRSLLGGRGGGLVYGSYRWNKLNIQRRTNKTNEMDALASIFVCGGRALMIYALCRASATCLLAPPPSFHARQKRPKLTRSRVLRRVIFALRAHQHTLGAQAAKLRSHPPADENPTSEEAAVSLNHLGTTMPLPFIP